MSDGASGQEELASGDDYTDILSALESFYDKWDRSTLPDNFELSGVQMEKFTHHGPEFVDIPDEIARQGAEVVTDWFVDNYGGEDVLDHFAIVSVDLTELEGIDHGPPEDN